MMVNAVNIDFIVHLTHYFDYFVLNEQSNLCIKLEEVDNSQIVRFTRFGICSSFNLVNVFINELHVHFCIITIYEDGDVIIIHSTDCWADINNVRYV